MNKTIDELLETPYWIADILPAQVPADSPGQYFAVEQYYLAEPRRTAIKQKHLNLILKLNCYRDLRLDEEADPNPPPERIGDALFRRRLCIRTEDAMIVSEPDETWLTVYNPDEALLELIRALAAGEGLFVWKPGQGD